MYIHIQKILLRNSKISAEVVPFDSTEGLNEEQAALAAGREMIVTNRQFRQLEGARSKSVICR